MGLQWSGDLEYAPNLLDIMMSFHEIGPPEGVVYVCMTKREK